MQDGAEELQVGDLPAIAELAEALAIDGDIGA